MKKMFNKILTGAVLIGMGLLGINEASAQNFQMQTAGATYNATCNAVIKMKNASSSFQVDPLNDFGQSTDVIDGIVDWASASGTQQVQAFYYEKMVVSGGGTKNLATGIFIMGLSDGCTPLFGYTNPNDYPYYVTGGTLVYNGTFNYGGAGTQNIWPNSATGDPDYTNLNFAGSGDKVVLGTDAVTVTDQVSSSLGTNLAIAGDLNLGTVASALNGTVDLDGTVVDPANLNMGAGSLTFNQAITVGNGSINSSDNGVGTDDGDVIVGSGGSLALTDDNSVLNFAGTELVVTGTISNGGTGANLDFTCTSIVTYNGVQTPQLILPTIASNPYGLLNLAGGNKRPQDYAYDNVYVCSTFDLQNGNLDMATNSGTLFMKEAAATYSALAEVVGKMARKTDFVSATPAAITNGTYKYNNTATEITFGGTAANPKVLTLDVTPGSITFNGYTALSDVKRSITLTHDATADFGLAVKAGYRFEEGPLGNPTYFGGVYTQPSIRMYEGFADNTSEKIGTGVQPTRVSAVAATSLGSVLLTDIGYTSDNTNSNDIDKFYSSNNIILRAGPTTFYTVNSGRWTNPNTWDEGALPAAIDDAEVRHSVYVGIDGPFIGTTSDGNDDTYDQNTKSELAHYGTNAAANSITVATGYTNAAIIIGNEDNGNGYVFHTAKNNGTSFSNQNATASTPTVTTIGAKASYVAANPGFNGLFLTTYGNSGAQLSAFGTYQLLNVGAINNMGIIEIGE